METLNIVLLNIIFLIGPVCGFYALRKIAGYFMEREVKQVRTVPRMTFCAWGTGRHVFSGRRG